LRPTDELWTGGCPRRVDLRNSDPLPSFSISFLLILFRFFLFSGVRGTGCLPGEIAAKFGEDRTSQRLSFTAVNATNAYGVIIPFASHLPRVDAETEKLGLDARLLGEAAYSEDR